MVTFCESLRTRVEALKGKAWADSTQKTYQSYRNSYLNFCKMARYRPVPTSTQRVCEYLVYLSDRLAYSSIIKYVGIIRIMYEELGLKDPKFLQEYDVKLVLLALKKELGAEVHRKAAMTPELLVSMYKNLDGSTEDVIVWAITLTAFFGLLRISNVLAPAEFGFVLGKHLAREDVTIRSDMVLLKLWWAKNNQFKERVPIVPLPAIEGHCLCPVQAVQEAFRRTARSDMQGPAFVRVTSKGGFKPVLYNWFSVRFLSLVRKAGGDPSVYGTHSLRRGGATWALKCGLSSDVIKLLGDWKSNAYQVYLDVPLREKQKYMRVFAEEMRKV